MGPAPRNPNPPGAYAARNPAQAPGPPGQTSGNPPGGHYAVRGAESLFPSPASTLSADSYDRDYNPPSQAAAVAASALFPGVPGSGGVQAPSQPNRDRNAGYGVYGSAQGSYSGPQGRVHADPVRYGQAPEIQGSTLGIAGGQAGNLKQSRPQPTREAKPQALVGGGWDEPPPAYTSALDPYVSFTHCALCPVHHLPILPCHMSMIDACSLSIAHDLLRVDCHLYIIQITVLRQLYTT